MKKNINITPASVTIPNTRHQPRTPLVSRIVNDSLLHVCPAVNALARRRLERAACTRTPNLKFSVSNPFQEIF